MIGPHLHYFLSNLCLSHEPEGIRAAAGVCKGWGCACRLVAIDHVTQSKIQPKSDNTWATLAAAPDSG
jgi:hypothetical protein